MEINKKDFKFLLNIVIIHTILYPLSFAFDMIHFYILLTSQNKFFFISCYIIQILLFIFLIKIMQLIKSRDELKGNINCNLLVYALMSFITLSFIIGEYSIIFKNFNNPKCKIGKTFKIFLVILSLLFHIYNNLSFIYELKLIKKIIDKISESQQSLPSHPSHPIRDTFNETRSSEKSKKNVSFKKEDTVYIIRGQFKENSITVDNVENIYEVKSNINSCTNRNLKEQLFVKKENNTQDINLGEEEKKEKFEIKKNENKTIDNEIIINNKEDTKITKVNPMEIRANDIKKEQTKSEV